MLLVSGCATDPGKKTAVGAGVGALVGAGVGAIIGHQSGERDKGALVGGLVGAGVGGAIGNNQEAKERRPPHRSLRKNNLSAKSVFIEESPEQALLFHS